MYEMLVGLNVMDDDVYGAYRDAMKPILNEYLGNFGYDFKVSEVLKHEGNPDINRVFTIQFKDKDHMERFFSDPNYLSVKEEFFTRSVGSTTIISEYKV